MFDPVFEAMILFLCVVAGMGVFLMYCASQAGII